MSKYELSIKQVNRAVQTLITEVGRDEALRLFVIAGLGPAVSDKLCGRRYHSTLREESARAFLKVMAKAGISLSDEVAS